MLGEMPAELLAERGVLVAGNPESCIESVRRHDEIGVDQLLLIMQSDQVSHEKVMTSIELFGKEVIPAFQETACGIMSLLKRRRTGIVTI